MLFRSIQESRGSHDAVVMNPGAFAHYSYAISDAITAAGVRLFEVHISNIHAREDFRHRSVIAPVAAGMITGLGTLGYELALEAAVRPPLPDPPRRTRGPREIRGSRGVGRGREKG